VLPASRAPRTATNDGKPVININVVAETTSVSGAPRTQHARVTAYDKVAEHVISMDLGDGDIIAFLGDPRAEKFIERRTSETKTYLVVVAQSVHLLDRATDRAKPNESAPAQTAAAAPAAETRATATQAAKNSPDDGRVW
jgi:hypothetical protein